MFDIANPFQLHRAARAEHIDPSGHVNNAVYLNWLNDAAMAHSEALGYDTKRYHEIGAVFVVRRHEIDYLRQGFEGDNLVVATWCGEVKRSTALRHYQIVRPADQVTLLRAVTKWAFMGLKSGRPQRIPDGMCAIFRDGVGALSKSER